MRKCIIVCNGEVNNYELFKNMFAKGLFVICADGGTRHLRKAGIVPDLIIGDLDSSLPGDIDFFESNGSVVKKFPPEKDYTDGELAFMEAISMGFDNVTMVACTGSRLDHTLANIFFLKSAADRGIDCSFANENNFITIIKGPVGSCADAVSKTFNSLPGYKLSLIPVSELCRGVSVTGVKYPLDNAVIAMGEAIGISNEFEDYSAVVSIKEGYLLVVLSKD